MIFAYILPGTACNKRSSWLGLLFPRIGGRQQLPETSACYNWLKITVTRYLCMLYFAVDDVTLKIIRWLVLFHVFRWLSPHTLMVDKGILKNFRAAETHHSTCMWDTYCVYLYVHTEICFVKCHCIGCDFTIYLCIIQNMVQLYIYTRTYIYIYIYTYVHKYVGIYTHMYY